MISITGLPGHCIIFALIEMIERLGVILSWSGDVLQNILGTSVNGDTEWLAGQM